MNIRNYRTLVFDCDGVILNANSVKTEAFYMTALPYGEHYAQALVDYHVARGGISRYHKFAHFLAEILPPTAVRPSLEHLLATYATTVRKGLLDCELAEGLTALRSQTAGARWLLVSGGDQEELREVFALRHIAALFDGGIFGSPDNKDTILARESARGNIPQPALFIGDSKYDYQAATRAHLDFAFLKKWSEFDDYEEHLPSTGIRIADSLTDLLNGGSTSL